MTIKEVMDKTTTFFKQKGFPSPRLDAELLIAYGLNVERMQLYLKFDQTLKDSEVEKLRDLVKRRTSGEPVAYILGKKDFYKGSFVVNKSVLIPRPETETLVELACAYIENESPFESFQILDIGGGSGCIGISLAKEHPTVHVSIIEKSASAAAVVAENIILNQVGNVTVFNCDANDLQSFVQAWKEKFNIEPVFDLIVSNPPYIAKDDKDVEENVKKFEPQEALFADDDGFLYLKEWAQKYVTVLKDDALMIFEMGQTQGNQILEHVTKLNLFKSVKIKKDLAYKDRFISMLK